MKIVMLASGYTLGILSVLIGQCILFTTGHFKINTVNPEEDYMKLHIDNQDHLFTKKYILLKIIRDENTSK